MYEIIKNMYRNGKLTDKGIDAAVQRGWLSQEQADQILEEGLTHDG